MARSMREGIREVKTLGEILPSHSSSSGREFARIVNLLLFHDGRRNGRTVTLFDDRAGDYIGLDAFEKRGDIIVVGYQHKFYSGPLSDRQRKDIEHSLLQTLESLKKSNVYLEKWVLVTPEDFVESARRKTGGDVTWFESLRKKHELPFEIEHWGHTQLQSLFLATPSIGLYYYPEHFIDGVERRRTIRDIRTRYDDVLKREYGRIEFVGMSVYKEEAARNVPMENIYIPLSLIPNGADEDSPDVLRRDPLTCRMPGTRHVILGDPGSGKTTLLRFLALFGQSGALQQRYGVKVEGKAPEFERDERLPVFLTLRRYADALKFNDNLSLFDYIIQNISADFSISGISPEFLEYYLESGQSILLFDGLDELPNSTFKQKIRNRIQNLSETYPGNTVVVSSRVYAYEGGVRFDDAVFSHHRLAKLHMEEIEQFVRDWYQARLEKPRDRKVYLDSLLGILQSEEHEAIRELARNPLLLTIMVLVHRIDAVLPDERHVLYQKCTETLLNTWHTWKFAELDRLHRAKVDRQNMQRMQSVAYWMHHEMGRTEAGRQAVVSYEALHRHMTKHIAAEQPANPDYAPEDIATAFIEFVQDRAGLLIEIGDRNFAFVHLTFQEYLAAAHIRTLSELNGVKEAWSSEIVDHCSDPRWSEVIRLLVAGYGSNASQKFLIERILTLDNVIPTYAQLLGGLLLDGVAAAQTRKAEIIARLVTTCTRVDDPNELKYTLAVLRSCIGKLEGDRETLQAVVRSIAAADGEVGHLRLRLTSLSVGMTLDESQEICGQLSDREAAIFALFTGRALTSTDLKVLHDDLTSLHSFVDAASVTSASPSFIAAILQSVTSGYDMLLQYKRAFECLLLGLSFGTIAGAFTHLLTYNLLFSPRASVSRFSLVFHERASLRLGSHRGVPLLVEGVDGTRVAKPVKGGRLAASRTQTLERTLRNIRVGSGERGARDYARDMFFDMQTLLKQAPNQLVYTILGQVSTSGLNETSEIGSAIWRAASSNPQFITLIHHFLCQRLNLNPMPLWFETMTVLYLPTIPRRMAEINAGWLRETHHVFETGQVAESDIYAAALQLILDGGLFMLGYYEPPEQWRNLELDPTDALSEKYKSEAAEIKSQFERLVELTRKSASVPIRIAHCIRDLAYGDESRAQDLRAMVMSDDPDYRDLFERCYWRLTEEERLREQQGANSIVDKPNVLRKPRLRKVDNPT
jgi:hypothetical protein